MYTLNFNPITCNHFLRKKNVTEYNWISFVIPKSWLLSIFYLHTLICIVNINRSIFFIYFNVVLWYGSSVLGKKSTCNFLVSWSFITCSSCILVNFRLLPTMQKITRNKSFVSFFPLKWIIKMIKQELFLFVIYLIQFVDICINTEWSWNIILPAQYSDASN